MSRRRSYQNLTQKIRHLSLTCPGVARAADRLLELMEAYARQLQHGHAGSSNGQPEQEKDQDKASDDDQPQLRILIADLNVLYYLLQQKQEEKKEKAHDPASAATQASLHLCPGFNA